MEKFYPSIFNDVLSPITQGPSSSNTVGPYRIGLIAREIVNGNIKKVKFVMSSKGGFKETFFSMDSDKGLLLGLFGKDLITYGLSKVYDLAEKEGVTYEFGFSDDIPAIPSEMGILTVETDEETIELRGISLGGGEILIDEFNGKKVDITGRFVEEFRGKTIMPIYPLKALKNPEAPFSTSEGMLRYAKEQGKDLFEVAVDYEMALTGETREKVLELASKALNTEYEAINKGFEGGFSFDGVTNPKAKEIREKMKTAKLIPTGIGDTGSLDALSIMEYSNAHGVIVCMPTGGATGIIPASIKSAAEHFGLSFDEQVKALLVAGLIGTFYYPTHYHGGLGCQAEVGIATSMAAAALCSMLTDCPVTCEKAAVLAMQYVIGQVCDPILGFVQVPCFIRNAGSVSLAATCANYAVLGLDTLVSLDGMADAVLRVGKALQKDRINDMGTCGSYCSKCLK
ncbi:MAG: L-serine ammonia-lyase, iron-sulfur-dependent, subunit alpha [Clostridia bacterium]|nr:L-serine ammonia-lyase, iron-sulfur-dependent, subunit alpha [Clostridia bacterium]